MDKYYLQVNAVNIITIFVMWLIGVAAIGLISAAVRGKFSSSSGEQS